MKKLLALILALVLCFSLVACGGDKKEDEAAKPENSGGAVEAKPVESLAPPSADQEYEEWVWTYWGAELDSADPHNRTGSQSEQFTTLTFDTVTYIDVKTGELMPELAYKWEPSADNKEWTFYLEENVTFHNGNKFTADDVKFTWEFAGINQGNVIKPISAYDYCESIEVVDDYTVKFILKSAMPDFATYLETKIYDKESFEELGQEKAGVIGTGPYYYDEAQRIPGQQFVATRYDNYWRGIENYPTKHIGYKIIMDAQAAANALLTGQIDFTAANQQAAVMPEFEADANVSTGAFPGGMIYHLAFNHTNPILSKLEVRRAICQAVNKEDIVNIFWEGGIGGFAHDNYCPPLGLGYSDNIDTLEYDLEAAKEVLEPLGLEMHLGVYPANQKLGEVLKACLEQAGMKITVDVIPDGWDAWKRACEYDMYAEYGSYQGALLYNFNRFFARGASSNPYKYDSQEFEDKLVYVREAPSYDEMLKRFEELQQFVADDIPSFPLGVSNQLLAWRNDVEGVEQGVAATVNWHDWSMVRIPKRG